MEVKFKKRYMDFNKGDTLEVTEQLMLTRLLALDVIEFPGQRQLVKPTPKRTAKKPSKSASKPKTAEKTAESSG